jgi:hypothetical protein
MERLVFIDEDETELENLRGIVAAQYDYVTVHWPDESDKLFSRSLPADSGEVTSMTRQ